METIADKGNSILIHEMEELKGQLNAAREALKECRGRKRHLKCKGSRLFRY